MKCSVSIDNKQKEVSPIFLEKISSLNNKLTKEEQKDLVFHTAHLFNFVSYLQTIRFLKGLGVYFTITTNDVRINRLPRTNFIDKNRTIRTTFVKEKYNGFETITNIILEEYNGL